MNLQPLEMFRLAANACGTKTGVWPSLYDNLTCTGGDVRIQSVSEIAIILTNITRIALAMSGGLAVVFILAASIYYITSAGDPGRTKRAKEIIQYTIGGLVLIVMAYAIITLISGGL